MHKTPFLIRGSSQLRQDDLIIYIIVSIKASLLMYIYNQWRNTTVVVFNMNVSFSLINIENIPTILATITTYCKKTPSNSMTLLM